MCANFNDFLTDGQLHWIGLRLGQDNSHILTAATTPSSTGRTATLTALLAIVGNACLVAVVTVRKQTSPGSHVKVVNQSYTGSLYVSVTPKIKTKVYLAFPI